MLEDLTDLILMMNKEIYRTVRRNQFSHDYQQHLMRRSTFWLNWVNFSEKIHFLLKWDSISVGDLSMRSRSTRICGHGRCGHHWPLVKLAPALWRICPTTVSFLDKSETIEINQKFKFLEEGIDVWKFLKEYRPSKSSLIINGIKM